MTAAVDVSIIVPAFNAQETIAACVEALRHQRGAPRYEVIVVDDGSSDATASAAAAAGARVVTQRNAGPAAARNNGARASQGSLLLFTDADCEVTANWVAVMSEPLLSDSRCLATKGAYLTRQTQVVPRLVQVEFETKFGALAHERYIDFVDSYSMGMRRSDFLAIGGFSEDFDEACAEDADLGYRLSVGGKRIRFVPDGAVYHLHPTSWISIAKKKYKFAKWRVLAVKRNPRFAAGDDHTSTLQLVQTGLPAVVLATIVGALGGGLPAQIPLFVSAFWMATAFPMFRRALSHDRAVAILTVPYMAVRSVAHLIGVFAGTWHFIVRPRLQ